MKCYGFKSDTVKSVNIAWGEPIPADYSELVNTENSRVAAGTQSKLTTIMTLDKVSEEDADGRDGKNGAGRADKMSLKEALEQMKQENSKDFESDTDKVDDAQNNPII
ncbi:MAG: hypothetical protein V8R83_12660 [Candidatus Gastranaerophilaceae bacterium]